LIDETRRVNTPKPGVRLGILIKGRRSPPLEVCPVARLFSFPFAVRGNMELKCTCDHCKQPLEFPAEMTGQTIACPHCKTDTTLFNPSQPAKPPAPKSKGQEFVIEDRLESIADQFFGLGILGAVISVIAAIFEMADGEVLIGAIFAAVAFSAYVQGLVIRILFYAASKALRLLTVIATQNQKAN
jgi:hypothetical protein